MTNTQVDLNKNTIATYRWRVKHPQAYLDIQKKYSNEWYNKNKDYFRKRYEIKKIEQLFEKESKRFRQILIEI